MHELEGHTLGNYRLVRLLGEGGFAQVYLGEHIHLHTQAAVKVLQGRVTAEIQAGFLNEAQLIASLDHPHIVRVMDFGVEHQLSFLVMSYASNGTLRQRHQQGSRLPIPLIVTYLKQIAAALQYAHDHNVIHRDVKPQNMLIGLDDELLLGDFGLAVLFQNTSTRRLQNQAGTLPYMAPEQFQGKAYPASDQYALGVVVYEWLCSEPPFQGTYHEIAMQHQLTAPLSLHEKMPAIPTALEQVMLKALAKDPTERFACVQDFAGAFDQACHLSLPVEMDSAGYRPKLSVPPLYEPALSRLPSPSSPLMSPSKAASYRQRHVPTRAHVLLSLVALIAIGSLGLFSLMLITHYTEVPVTAIPKSSIVATAAARAYTTGTSQGVISSGFDAEHTNFNPYERVLNATNVSHLVPDWTVSTGSIVQSSPIIISNTVFVIGNKLYAKLYALDASTGQPLWAATIGPSSSPAAANGIIYIGSYDGKLYAFDVITGKLRWAASVGNSLSDPIVADGTVYIGSYDGKLYALDAITGKPRWTASLCNCRAPDPTVADGVVYIGSENGKLYAFDAITGKLRWAASVGNEEYTYPLLTATSDIIYAGSGYGKIYAFNTSTGKQLWVASVSYGDASWATVANGVAYVVDRSKLYAFVASTGKPLWRVTVSNDPTSIIFSPMVANGVIYIGSEYGKLFALAASNGNMLWSASVGGVASSPVVANGILYAGSDDGNLYTFHLAGSPA